MYRGFLFIIKINYDYIVYKKYNIYVFFVHSQYQNNSNKKYRIMKSLLFKTAWSLFRKYNITFSQALTKAWNDVKRQMYISVYNSIPSKPQFAKKKLEAKKMYEKFNVSFQLVARNVVDNSGAAFYYDGVTLNMD